MYLLGISPTDLDYLEDEENVRKCDGWLICPSIWWRFSAQLSQKHLIETSHRLDEDPSLS